MYVGIVSSLIRMFFFFCYCPGDNTQHDGYGLRGEIMIGQKPSSVSDIGWEFGPFVRYWNIKDSNITTAPDGSQWIEAT